MHAEEASGRNKLPLAYAHALGEEGLEVEDSAGKPHIPYRRRRCGQLFSRPKFTGPVEQGRPYIIVDDVSTSGSTLAAPRDYIESKGGKVVAASSLATTSSPQTGYGGASGYPARHTGIAVAKV